MEPTLAKHSQTVVFIDRLQLLKGHLRKVWSLDSDLADQLQGDARGQESNVS